ncbi:MAG: SRPBCC domain-containing protein [Thermoleophilia bacterium]|nr:SRPBCC domain-containing protein [Thermoleophilia bacterium]
MEESVRREVVFREPREDVWRALTDPERLAEWFANEVELDPRPGGAGRFRWDDGSERRATVEEVERDRRFAFRWRDAEAIEPETLVELTLEDDADGTRLVVVETPAAGAEWAPALSLRAAFAAVAV